MRIIVTGSRTWDRPDVIWKTLDIIAEQAAAGEEDLFIVHGACPRGADFIADGWVLAKDHPLPVHGERHPANWERHGRRAGLIRNAEMVDLGADLLLAFIRDGSRGALHTVRLAEESEIPTKVIEYRPLEPTVADRCALTDLRPDDCAHCRKVPDPFAGPDPAPTTGMRGVWFPALFAGRCADCATDFEVGDQIRTDGTGGWVAECCGEDED